MTAMGWKAAVCVIALGASAVLGVAPAVAQSADVDRRQEGALRLENVPSTPPEVRERLRQYVNTRGAGFVDFTADGGILVSTRFGDSSQIHRVDAPMGARSQLTFYDEPVGGALIRPDGEAFVFTRDVGGDENFAGFLQNLSDGRVTQFTAPGTRNQSFVWSRDGSRLAWTQVPAGDPNWDIMIGDPSAPDGRRLALDGEGAVAALDFSPDGSKLLIGQYISILKSRRFVLDLASGELTELAADLDAAFDGGVFAADGRSVIVGSDEGGEFVRLVRIDLATGARTPLTSSDEEWDVESFAQSRDGRLLVFARNVAGQSELTAIDPRSGRVNTRMTQALRSQAPVGVISGLTFSTDGRRLGMTVNAATAPSDAYSFDVSSGRLTRWTASEVGGLDAAGFVAPELVRWSSFDGREITGFAYLPRGEGPHPVIIQIHGGPEAQSRPTFSSTIQYWVNELGAAVISPNVRGSSGFGRTFLALDNAALREDAVKDIGALLDWIATQPQFDSERVLVYGGSYGGYMVLASMTHYNDRLAGAVNIVGISSFVTFLENTSGYRRDLRRVEYGDERDPEMRAVLERISPLTNISRVTKPMFVIHGANDPRVPVSEADQVIDAIRGNGGEVWAMIAADEGHGFRKRPNQEAQREAETLFFQRVLRISPGN